MRVLLSLLVLVVLAPALAAADPWIEFQGSDGPGAGKRVVLISGDEEYRSEEALPMLAKILSRHHGFDTRVLFAIHPESGEIDPTYNQNIPGLEALAEADLMIIATRWRNLPAEQMAHVDAYLKSGRPVIGLRTATHAFKLTDPEWAHYSDGYNGPQEAWYGGFGRLVLGEQWISHHGAHGSQATRGLVTPEGQASPITRGVGTDAIFGDTDVYGVRLPLPGDSHVLVLGQVLSEMTPDSPPLQGEKNDPMMPIAWTKSYQLPDGKPGRAMTITMGSSTDFANAALRRLLVNGVFALVGLEEQIPQTGTNVDIVGDYQPTKYGFGQFQKGVKPADLAETGATNGAANPPKSENSGAFLDLQPGEHISLIGNTLADRMQHTGAWETLLHARFPKSHLTIRNLAFSADTLTVRQRSEAFGTPDEWLTRTNTDVLFAFFGFNESFAGEAGLPAFREELAKFIEHTKTQKYNGKTAPRLILFSPIAAEDTQSRVLPSASRLNAQISPYVEAMREVAKEQDVPFVDLFEPTREAYDAAEEPLTINGVHLTAEGYRTLATILDDKLFGESDTPTDWNTLEELNKAVLAKNFDWYQRYRTTDGYSIYGGRSHLEFVGGQTNRVVMQREMEVLDAMTANHDREIWSLTSEGAVNLPKVELPPFLEVTTNLPGKGSNGTHLFLSGEEAIEKMTIGQGLRVNLFASEEQFPELINPVQMAWDLQGRLFVAAWETYPHWKPDHTPPNDKILILEDTDGDGRADSCTTFADGLHNPTGFEFWNGGVLVAMAPELLFLKDTDGDGVADEQRILLHGLDTADTHHTANSFVIGPDGGLYFQEGVFHRTQVETPYGPIRNKDACVWRFDPRTFEVTRYAAYGFANPHGHVFDAWGNDIIHDGTGANPYQGSLISGFLPEDQKHAQAPEVYPKRTRPCPATEILHSRHFPESFQGNLLVGNVIGFQGLLRYGLKYEGSALVGVEEEPFFSSSDPNFRPVDFEVGPDGALYFTDWQNPVIGHMQHNLRDPNRDQVHGRVYRVIHEGRELLSEPNMTEMSTADLFELLKSPEIRTRYRARIALSAKESGEVAETASTWLGTLDASDANYWHQQAEAMWVLQGHHMLNRELIDTMLKSPEPLARAAATRVVSFEIGKRLDPPVALDLLRTMANDDDPRVRREAVRAAGYLPMPEAMEVLTIARAKPLDPALEYLLSESQRAIEPVWRAALESGTEIALTTDAGQRFLLQELPVARLLEMPLSPLVARELLTRPGVTDEARFEAVNHLVEAEQRTPTAILLEMIAEATSRATESADGPSVSTDLVRLLVATDPAELAKARNELERMASQSPTPSVRQVAFAALMEIDGSSDAAWKIAGTSPEGRINLLRSIPRVGDPAIQSAQFPRIAEILDQSRAKATPSQAPRARYVRISLSGRKTLTLAEVEVYSRGENVAPQGTATQSSTAHGAGAERAIDGNRSGRWSDNGQTHSEEGEAGPWWELDLKSAMPIEAIVVYNRTDGNLGQRLNGFTAELYDENHESVWRKTPNEAPEVSVRIEVAPNDPEVEVRRAAMDALVALRGHEAESLRLLAGLIAADIQRDDAISALRRIPHRFWTAAELTPLLDGLLAEVRKVPPAGRTTKRILARLELADAIASLLPVADARALRAQLRELGVRVIGIGTLPERMAYDKDLIAVAAGKPVEIVFDNSDLMPHNLVIVRPGSLEEVGVLAESSARDPNAAERGFVPASPNVILASRLLMSRESQRLSFEAPSKPGVYPYVCTYPGHWRRMYGALYVVEDLDAYLADPEEYLAANPLPIHDDMLKDRRPRTAWTMDDLLPAVSEELEGRSFATGRQMFKVANCIACHKLNGEGQELGPDLTKLDPSRITGEEILKSLLDPTERIEEKYRSHVIVTDEGRVITGMILAETDDTLQVIENPLASTEPITLEKSAIEERQPSPLSIMPKGLLDTLTREEILDLIAFVQARGDQSAKIFGPESSGHQHGAAHQHDPAHQHASEHGHDAKHEHSEQDSKAAK